MTDENDSNPKPAPTEVATTKQLQEVEGRMSGFERSTLRWTRTAVFLSALAAAFVCAQWWEMHEGSRDTHDLAIASKALAQNATDALANNRNSFREEQRAWIGVQQTTGRPLTEIAPWNVQVTFFNSGRMPARHVQIAALSTMSNVPLSGPPTEMIKLLTFHRAQSLAPQGVYHANFGSSVPTEALSVVQMQGQMQLINQYSLIRSGKLLLYYFGVVKYDDGFGNQKWTRFCVMLANPKTGEAGYCDRFNDLD